MNKPTRLLAIIACAWAISTQAEEVPFYPGGGYMLEKLTDAAKVEALAPLGSIVEFGKMGGRTEHCGAVYHLSDAQGLSVAYGAICETSDDIRKAFVCWDRSGEHYSYVTLIGPQPDWIGDSILHGCGGVLVPDETNGGQGPDSDTDDPSAQWIMPELKRGERRPPLTMLRSDIEGLGFDIPLGDCEKTRFIYLGRERNTVYGAICEIDGSGKKALICFDNLVGHFGLFTRYQDASRWVEHTLYRFCWGG